MSEDLNTWTLDNFTSLNSKSHILGHVMQDHQQMNMEEVRWGMFIIKYKRTAFEGQIGEAVKIIETKCLA